MNTYKIYSLLKSQIIYNDKSNTKAGTSLAIHAIGHGALRAGVPPRGADNARAQLCAQAPRMRAREAFTVSPRPPYDSANSCLTRGPGTDV